MAHTQNTLVHSIRVSQGSVATRITCGGIFNDSSVANCPHHWIHCAVGLRRSEPLHRPLYHWKNFENPL